MKYLSQPILLTLSRLSEGDGLRAHGPRAISRRYFYSNGEVYREHYANVQSHKHIWILNMTKKTTTKIPMLNDSFFPRRGHGARHYGFCRSLMAAKRRPRISCSHTQFWSIVWWAQFSVSSGSSSLNRRQKKAVDEGTSFKYFEFYSKSSVCSFSGRGAIWALG